MNETAYALMSEKKTDQMVNYMTPLFSIFIKFPIES